LRINPQVQQLPKQEASTETRSQTNSLVTNQILYLVPINHYLLD